jgi:fermentation-respiration switch protein FrsA (DUF1100 family)
MSSLRCLVVLSLLVFTVPLHAQSPIKDPAHCLSRLLIATGLGASDGLEVGGDNDVVLVHDGAGAQSRYLVLTSRGQYSVVKPWPKSGSVGSCVGLPGDVGQRTSQLASSEQAKFQALAKAPLELLHYDLVRRQDHAEWRHCTAKQDIAAPMLFVQGERDPFGTPEELAPILRALPRARLMTVAGGDHSLAVPKRARPQAEVDAEVLDAVAAFIFQISSAGR